MSAPSCNITDIVKRLDYWSANFEAITSDSEMAEHFLLDVTKLKAESERLRIENRCHLAVIEGLKVKLSTRPKDGA